MMTNGRRPESDGDLSVAVHAMVDNQIRPLLHIHGGDVAVQSISADGVVHLTFQGACRACPLKAVTYALSVRQRLMEISGVSEVVVQQVRLSKSAITRVDAAYRGYSLDMFAHTEAP